MMKKIALALTLSLPLAAHANWLDLASSVLNATQQASGNNTGALSQAASIAQALQNNQNAQANNGNGVLQTTYLQNLSCNGLATEFLKQQSSTQVTNNATPDSKAAVLGVAGSLLSSLAGESSMLSQAGQIATSLASQNTASNTNTAVANQNMQLIAAFLTAKNCG